MKILTAIVTYNRCSTLIKSLEAHVADGTLEENIWIIDNASTDNTVSTTQDRFPNCNIILNPDNIGSAGGFAICMNIAVQKDYDYVWLYNDDSRPLPGANNLIRNTIKTLSSSNFGMVKMSMLRDDKAEANFWENRRITRWVQKSNTPLKTSLVTFDGCIINTKLIKEIGTCNPLFFMGIYEFDFCLRATEQGFAIFTLPAGLIEDEKKGSVDGTPYWRKYYVTRNHLYLVKKRSKISEILSFLFLEFKKSVSIILFQSNKFQKLKYKYLAFRDGFAGKMGKTVVPT